MVTIMHAFGLVGNLGGGLIEIAATNWVPLFGNHWSIYIAQFIIGFIFIFIYSLPGIGISNFSMINLNKK